MSTTTTLHLTITGRVQGVGFRIYMQREAMRYGVSGWVRNRSDGGVEAMVQGPTASVEALVEWARHGPPKAQVTDLQAGAGSGDYADFEVRATE